jgi:hypothetical protein
VDIATSVARQLSIRRKGDPPEILDPVVFFEKLDSVGADALHTGDLRDHSGEHLSRSAPDAGLRVCVGAENAEDGTDEPLGQAPLT